MHNLFYGIGGVSLLPAGYLLVMAIDGGGVAALQWAIYVLLGACLWIAIGRGLELLARIADAVAPREDSPAPPRIEDQPILQERAYSRGL